MTEFEAWGPSEPIPDSAADGNLALNADAWKYPRIFPSFAFINNSVFMVHDGDAKTFWGTRESRNGANEFLRVDFGEEKTFDRIDVNFRYAPTSMNLEYLNSGTWTAIQNVQMYPSTANRRHYDHGSIPSHHRRTGPRQLHDLTRDISQRDRNPQQRALPCSRSRAS